MILMIPVHGFVDPQNDKLESDLKCSLQTLYHHLDFARKIV